MKLLKFLIVGILFGIVLAKAEVISWYRIQEMFRFQSFHMYGIIGVAVVMGVGAVQAIKQLGIRDNQGNPIVFNPKAMSVTRYLVGGAIFGCGWALVGACPGPMVVNVGYGYSVFLVIILGAILGTYLYGILRDKLPH